MSSILLLSLFFCHFLADFTPLSTKWMLDAKRFGKPLPPVWIHAKVHGCLMAIPLFFAIGFTSMWAYLVIFQIVSHFIIDLWKGRMNGWFPALQSPANKSHWIIFGFDQFLHASVIILMVYLTGK